MSSLNASGVEYLLVGGYAVTFHGYSRSTNDLDVWIAVNADNAERLVAAIREFGFNDPDLTPDFIFGERAMLRMGMPPMRIEILTIISGVEFAECYARRVIDSSQGVDIPIISLADLITNKKASGRNKDLADLDYLLPGVPKPKKRR